MEQLCISFLWKDGLRNNSSACTVLLFLGEVEQGRMGYECMFVEYMKCAETSYGVEKVLDCLGLLRSTVKDLVY